MPRSQDWDNFWNREASQKFQNISWSKRRILNVLTPYLQPGKCALDAGCGSGFFANHFAQQGMATTAVDYAVSALAMARKLTQGKVTTAQVDFLKDDLAQKLHAKFDLIFTDGLFEHFSTEEQDRIMRNFIAVLTDDGVVVTFVPNRFSPWEIIRPLFMPGIEEKPFILPQLVRLQERNGLKIIQKGGVNTLPFAFSAEGKVAEYLGMLLYTVARKK